MENMNQKMIVTRRLILALKGLMPTVMLRNMVKLSVALMRHFSLLTPTILNSDTGLINIGDGNMRA